MRFLLHVVGHVSHYVVFYTTLPYLFIHSSQLEFWNLAFFIPCHSLYRKLWFKVWNYIVSFDSSSWTRKSDNIWPRYEVFIACGGSCLSVCSLLQNITLPFHSLLSSSFGIKNFSSYVVAYLVSFDSRFETRKYDIIRPRYEVFNACGGSCLSLWSVLHKFTIPFHSLLSARVSEFGYFHSMSYPSS